MTYDRECQCDILISNLGVDEGQEADESDAAPTEIS